MYKRQDVDSLVIDSLVTGANTMKSNQESVTRFIMAWFDAIHAVETIPDQVFTSIGKQIKQTKETVAIDYAGLKKGDIAMNQRMFAVNGRLLEATKESAKLLKEDLRHGRIIRDDVEINPAPLLAAIKDWKP